MAYGILVPWSGIEPMPPAVEAWNLNHWTAKEVPLLAFLIHWAAKGELAVLNVNAYCTPITLMENVYNSDSEDT